jgi:L-2-hydroxyglutarate oxidase LhgO
MSTRVGVVGAGIVGLAVARRLTQQGADVVVFEKENDVSRHQSGHNSGVVHSGIYYVPGSLKATLCRRGVHLLQEFCAEHSLPYEEIGKVIVARDSIEIGRLREIERRGEANGVPKVRWLDATELNELEPHVKGVAALHSPTTAIVDYVAVARAIASDLDVRFGTTVTGISSLGERVRVRAGETEHVLDKLVICAGLQSDVVAQLAGDDPGPAIIPFRGEYYKLRPQRANLVNALVYPVPDPAYPFLGVHFTPRIDGTVDVGPNAVVALAREGYRRRDVNLRDLARTVRWPGARKLAAQHWRAGVQEMRGSLSKRVYLAGAREYLPDLTLADLVPSPAGIRAQAVDRDGSLVDDFRISSLGPVTAVRNAPSPAATSSLAIAEHVVDRLA